MTLYLWFKAGHLISLIAWFAGIFYLPRLFVYHVATTDEISLNRFQIMEDKLYRIIMRPAMLATWFFGIGMVVVNWDFLAGQLWLWLKLLLIAGLVAYQLYCARIITSFARDQVTHSERFFRIFNEIPVLILIPVVLLAVFRPF